jgi:hypothetical protein
VVYLWDYNTIFGSKVEEYHQKGSVMSKTIVKYQFVSTFEQKLGNFELGKNIMSKLCTK